MSILMLSRKNVIRESGITRGQLDAAVEKGTVITDPTNPRRIMYSVVDCQAVVAASVAKKRDVAAKRTRQARRSELNEVVPEGYLSVDQTRDVLNVKGRQHVSALAARYAWGKRKWGSSTHRIAYLESDVMATKAIRDAAKAEREKPKTDPNQMNLDDYLGVAE